MCNKAVMVRGWKPRRAYLAVEPADPVEADEYLINGVAVSNFVLPEWYSNGTSHRYDFMSVLKAPMTLSPGGYQSFSYDGHHWQQVFGSRKRRKFHKRARSVRRVL